MIRLGRHYVDPSPGVIAAVVADGDRACRVMLAGNPDGIVVPLPADDVVEEILRARGRRALGSRGSDLDALGPD